MRCRVGDLAMVVFSLAGNEGRIVKCLRLSHYTHTLDAFGRRVYTGPIWETDTAMKSADGSLHQFAPDGHLRPIRDNDGEDEMLRIAGLPREIAHA